MTGRQIASNLQDALVILKIKSRNAQYFTLSEDEDAWNVVLNRINVICRSLKKHKIGVALDKITGCIVLEEDENTPGQQVFEGTLRQYVTDYNNAMDRKRDLANRVFEIEDYEQ